MDKKILIEAEILIDNFSTDIELEVEFDFVPAYSSNFINDIQVEPHEDAFCEISQVYFEGEPIVHVLSEDQCAAIGQQIAERLEDE